MIEEGDFDVEGSQGHKCLNKFLLVVRLKTLFGRTVEPTLKNQLGPVSQTNPTVGAV